MCALLSSQNGLLCLSKKQHSVCQTVKQKQQPRENGKVLLTQKLSLLRIRPRKPVAWPRPQMASQPVVNSMNCQEGPVSCSRTQQNGAGHGAFLRFCFTDFEALALVYKDLCFVLVCKVADFTSFSNLIWENKQGDFLLLLFHSGTQRSLNINRQSTSDPHSIQLL